MNQTPPELLAPYKAPLIEHARALLRAAGTDGIAFEIPASIPPCTIVVGATDQIGKLLRTPSREPMLGGRRAGDPVPDQLQWDEPKGPEHFTATASSDDLWQIAVVVAQLTGGTLLDISQHDCVAAIRASFLDPDSAREYLANQQAMAQKGGAS